MSLSNLEIVTLSLLTTADRTGYDIRKWLDQYGHFVGYNAQTSQIYRQLGTMEERSWATSRPGCCRRSASPGATRICCASGRAAADRRSAASWWWRKWR